MSWDWQEGPKGWLRVLGPLFGLLGGRMEHKVWTGQKRQLENTEALAPPDQRWPSPPRTIGPYRPRTA